MKLPKLTKKQWIIAGSVLVVLLVVGIYLYLEYRKKIKAAGTNQEEGARVIPLVPDNVNLFSDCPNDTFPLKFGKCGKKVEQFQIYLINKFGAQFPQYGVDGKWGDELELVAKKFILKNGVFSISEDYFNKAGMANYKTVKYA